MWLIYEFWGHVIWVCEFKKGRKRKTNVFYKNKKLSFVTLFSKINIESEHIITVNRTKNYLNALIFLCFCQYLDEPVVLSCQQF